MQKAGDDFTPQVGRGQRGDQRLPETAETHVGRLITQRRLASVSDDGNRERTHSSRAADALRGACYLSAHAQAAPIAPIIAMTALAALGLSGEPVHEAVHARGPGVWSSRYFA